MAIAKFMTICAKSVKIVVASPNLLKRRFDVVEPNKVYGFRFIFIWRTARRLWLDDRLRSNSGSSAAGYVRAPLATASPL